MKAYEIDQLEGEVIQAEGMLGMLESQFETAHNKFRQAMPNSQWESMICQIENVRHKLTHVRTQVVKLRHELPFSRT